MVVVFLTFLHMFPFQKHSMLLFFLVLFLLTRRLGGEAELHIDELHITSRVSKLLLLS